MDPHLTQADETPRGGPLRFTYSNGARPLVGYTIKRGIGRGGFGEVYFAVSDGGKEVALKLVRGNGDSAIELRGASFLWVADLSKPDTIFIIPGINFPFNLLPLIMGGTMLWQAHLTPPSPGMDPAQAKMMRYMPLIFMVFLYNFSAGLTLYWTVQNLLSILKTKLIKMMPEVPTPPSGPVLTGLPKRRK